MDFSKEVNDFVAEKIGGICIICVSGDSKGQIVYADEFYTKRYGTDICGKNASETLSWSNGYPGSDDQGNVVSWECVDDGRYYSISSATFQKDGQSYTIHKLSDRTEYMELSRDVAKYMALFKRLSKFQTKIIQKISDTYEEILPMASEYFKSNAAFIVIERHTSQEIVLYKSLEKTFEKGRVSGANAGKFFYENESSIKAETIVTADERTVEELKSLLDLTEDTEYIRVCAGEVEEQRYAIFIQSHECALLDEITEPVLVSVIDLFIENSLMREKIIYNSEHDQLTGLYNKGKYLERIESEYPLLDSIAIFNMDVNNLKKMNDTYGHEAGDKLLIKAADSMRKVASDNIHAYRMGGDEFMIIAANVTEEESLTIKERWEAELARLNTYADGIECIVACGLVHAVKPYDLGSLLKEADELMYIDKKAKKKPGEEIR